MTDHPNQAATRSKLRTTQLPERYTQSQPLLQALLGYLDEKGVDYLWSYGGAPPDVVYTFYINDINIKVYEELFVPYLKEQLKLQPTRWLIFDNNKIREKSPLADLLITIRQE